ncbi:type II toxin-antitoxin system PrlF family antitoxin, partial [Acidobacteria bacterium AH-259-G07]|nr:type II toxin-antitoxin system PrlF family antitoxin [Acidobacteria bacterium AH-259-G07]
PSSTITSKGQVTIPKAVRDQLKLHPGDRLDFWVQEDGKIIVRKASISVEELEGILYRPDIKPVPIEEMKRAVRKRFGAKS